MQPAAGPCLNPCTLQAVKADPGNSATQKDLLEVQCCGAAGPPASGALLQLADARLAAQVSSMLPSAGGSPDSCCAQDNLCACMKDGVITLGS